MPLPPCPQFGCALGRRETMHRAVGHDSELIRSTTGCRRRQLLLGSAQIPTATDTTQQYDNPASTFEYTTRQTFKLPLQKRRATGCRTVWVRFVSPEAQSPAPRRSCDSALCTGRTSWPPRGKSRCPCPFLRSARLCSTCAQKPNHTRHGL